MTTDAAREPVPLIARRAELATIEQHFTNLARGSAGVVVESEAGMGKTSLWRAAVEHARKRDMLVLECHPCEAEAHLAFAGLSELLDRLPDEALRSLPDPQRHALEVALLRAPSGLHPPDQRAIGMALLSLVRHLSRSSEVVVAVDDAQWLDAASTAVLEFTIRRLQMEPVAVLVTVRVSHSSQPGFDRAIAAERRTVLRLEPFSVRDLHALFLAHLHRSFPRPRLLQIAQTSGGNPLYALEIARELLATGASSSSGHVLPPGAVVDLIALGLRRLPTRTRTALLEAAALSHPTSDAVNVTALIPAERAGIVRPPRRRTRHIRASSVRRGRVRDVRTGCSSSAACPIGASGRHD